MVTRGYVMLREFEKWIKMKNAENVDLNISKEEWQIVKAVVKERMDAGEAPPFKVERKDLQIKFSTRKDLQEKVKGQKVIFNHSFTVIPDPDPNIDPNKRP